MKHLRLLVASAVGGVLITLLTGLANHTPDMLVGAVWYGYPLAWLVQIVYPGTPYTIRPLRFIADIVFWAVILLLALYAYTKLIKKKP